MIKDTLGAFLPGSDVQMAGAAKGPLRGLTFAAKDIYDVAGQVTGCGNPDWARSHQPAVTNAPSVQAWLDAGAELVGKTITDELAFSLNGQNHHYGSPTNPNAPGRITGGSSSGSASAVAGGLVDLAFGSDTGGSVRIPASYCGLYGIRTSHGAIPLTGIMPLGPSLDTVGWFARDPEVFRKAGEALLGQSVAKASPPRRLLIAEDAFAVVAPQAAAALSPWVERLEALLGKGEAVRAGDPEGLEAWSNCFRTILGAEAWASHGDWIRETKPAFGPDLGARFEMVSQIPAETWAAAREERQILAARMTKMLEGGAVLCKPAACDIAPLANPPAAEAWDAHRTQTHQLTCIAGLSYLPEVSLPLATIGGCPYGLSLVGAPGSDMMLLALAEQLARPAGEATVA